MANLCMVSYYCEGTKEQLEELNSVLEFLQNLDKPLVENSRGNLWFGCIVDKLGGKWEDVECRGEVVSFDYDEELLLIEQDTDWCEQEGFRRYLEQRFPGLKIYLLEIEPCSAWGGTNDKQGKYFPYRYYLSSAEGYDFFNTLEDVAKIASQVVGSDVEPDFDTISEVLEEYSEAHDEDEEECFYNLYEIVIED